jgi:hypothetical protein
MERGEMMIRKWIMMLSIFILIIFGFNLRSMAGCKSDCKEDYESEVESCKEQYDDPSDAEELKVCIDDAKSEYQACIEECEN